ncbi:membrane-spanning 4-domains subfamily A member 12-like [Gastrophryne carolinensis]
MSSTGDYAEPPPSYWSLPPVAPGYHVTQNAQMGNVPAQPVNLPAPQPGDGPVTIMPPATQSLTALQRKLLDGQLKSFGVALITVGVIHIGLGIGFVYTASYNVVRTGIPFWGAAFYIIAGSLTIAAVFHPSMCLVRGSLWLSNIIPVLCIVGVALSIMDFFVSYCHSFDFECNSLAAGGNFVRFVFIFTFIILFCLSISISVIDRRVLTHPSPAATLYPQVFVAENPSAAQQPPSYPSSYPAYPRQPPAQQFYMAQEEPPMYQNL